MAEVGRAFFSSCCAPEQEQTTGKRRMRAVKAYLVLYDAVLFLGWAAVALWMLFRVGQQGVAWLACAWGELAQAMFWLQGLVLLDVVHGLLGFWGKSDIALVKRIWCKVGRRSELFVSILLLHFAAHGTNNSAEGELAVEAGYYARRVLSCWVFGATFVTWAVTDVIRYPFYACSSMGMKPQPLVWLRYSVFLPQYPAVLLCELFSVLLAAPALLQIGFLQVEGPFEGISALGVQLLPPMAHVCLVNYFWVAIVFQARNLRTFPAYYRILVDVRRTRLAHMWTRKARATAVATAEEQRQTTRLQRLDQLVRCDVPTVDFTKME